MVPLKYLRNFWRTLEMPLNWSESIFIVAINVATQTTLYSIPDTNFMF